MFGNMRIGIGIGIDSAGGVSKPNGNPSALTLTVLSDTSIKCDWINGADNQDGTYIYYRVTGAANFTLYGSVLGQLNTGLLENLTENTSYDVYVQHYKGNGANPKVSDVSNTAVSFTFPPLSKFLFLGYYSEITDGKMPNKLGTDWLTVSGSAGSETYQCPNTADYITADTDYIWFKTNATQRTTTTNELIGYDLQRTPVKYDNSFPYQIRIIAILKIDSVLNNYERNSLFSILQLPILWDNELNNYGAIKGNRVTQNLWNPEVSTLMMGVTHSWKLNEISGNAIDGVGSNNGTTNQVTYSATGKLGNGFDFNQGNNSYVDFGSMSDIPKTISIWGNRDTISNWGGIFGHRSDFDGLIVFDNGNIILLNGAGTALATWNSVWTDKINFHHILLLWEGTGTNDVELYFDGVSKGVVNCTVSAYNKLIIGNISSKAATRGYDGIFDDIVLWNRRLTTDEIAELYNSGIGKSYPF